MSRYFIFLSNEATSIAHLPSDYDFVMNASTYGKRNK